MKKQELLNLVDPILPRLYGFSFALTGDELKAQEILVNAYTVYLINEVDDLQKTHYATKSKSVRNELRKSILKDMLAAIFENACKKSQTPSSHFSHQLEHNDFYELSFLQRGIIYLKEIGNYSIEDLQEIFKLKRHQVLEAFYNSKNELCSGKTCVSIGSLNG